MIQIARRVVSQDMSAHFAVLDLPAAPALRRWSELRMSVERPAGQAAEDWAARIAAIANRQDREAFAELFRHFAPRVKGFLRRNGASDAQAEEIAQEAMLTIWRKAQLFDPAASGAATWIFTIARNLRIDAIRREKRGGGLRVEEVEAEYEIDATPTPDAQIVAAQSEASVRGALDALPDDQLKVIQLSYFEERSHGEIAQALQIPLGTVKSRLRLAMKRLRSELEAER
jgi:RNA polymerase sigma-70 factor (ECF subfamily)